MQQIWSGDKTSINVDNRMIKHRQISYVKMSLGKTLNPWLCEEVSTLAEGLNHQAVWGGLSAKGFMDVNACI